MAQHGSIVFPLGAGGNHLRWLLYPDQCFPVLENMDKLDFIRQHVYGSSRTWNTWLSTEVKYRSALDPYVALLNGQWAWEETTDKELYLDVTDWDVILRHYWHLNLGMNSETPDSFKRKMQGWCQEYKVLQQRIDDFPQKKIMHADPLFDAELDQAFYHEMIEFFGFDNNYNTAKQIHELYYECRCRSARDFVSYVESSEWKNYIETMKGNFSHNK